MLIIGSHVSYKNDTQLIGCVKETLSYGANAFMFYTGAPQNTQRGEIDDLKTYEAMQLMKDNNIKLEHCICHAPYIINLANNIDLDKYQFTLSFLRKEIDRCQTLGIKYLVLHPGSATKLDKTTALNNIINSLNKVLLPEDNIVILLETMAGKGSECGISLDELSYIINNVSENDKIGVCLDTCHLNDSGINIEEFDKYLELFNNQIGLFRIGCIHINDSKNPCGAKKDRHENIGFGTIGFENLLKVIYNPLLSGIPKILETPYVDHEYPPYKFEIMMIKEKQFNENLYGDIINYYKNN